MRLMPDGEKVRLCDMEPGLFLFGDDCLALKTEYISESGRIEAYIVSTGEFFHGGAKTAAEQRSLMVQPLKVDEVVHDRLLVLPCPIGSTVYIIGHKYRAGWDECWINPGKFRPSDLEKIGERVFLTYEDAKAKILAMNKGNPRFRFIERGGGDGK